MRPGEDLASGLQVQLTLIDEPLRGIEIERAHCWVPLFQPRKLARILGFR